MTTSFSITYDYRCPYARNAHEHVALALEQGADWDVKFVSFSLGQVHVDEGGVAVWDDPSKEPTLWAPEAGIVVRERFPDKFLGVHVALFTARHDEGRDIRERDVLIDILGDNGVDGQAVMAEVDDGWPRDAFRKEHEASVAEHKVFGVPTFVLGDQAVFVRLNTRPQGDAQKARTTIDGVLHLMEEHHELNEFKHTSLAR